MGAERDTFAWKSCTRKLCAQQSWLLVCSGVISLLFLIAGPASASIITTINPASGSETSLAEPGGILDILYGLSNLTRVSDGDSETTDQYWGFSGPDGEGTARIRAKFAGFNHRFGHLSGATGSDFHSLIDTSNLSSGIYGQKKHGDNPPPQSFTQAQTGEVFRLGLDLVSKPGWLWSSVPKENTTMPGGATGDGIDHMVTWMITGSSKKYKNNVIGNYVVSWEDLSADGQIGSYDGDYNDVVVELSGVQPGSSPPVPEPVTCVLFAMSALLLRGHKARHQRLIRQSAQAFFSNR